MDAVLPFEERAVPKLPPVARGYQVVSHPDRPLPLNDVKNVITPRAFPPLDIVGARAGDHVRKTARAAPQALRHVITPFI